MQRRILLVALLVSLASLGGVSSQAPELSSEVQTLYLHGTGEDELNGFMNTLEEDGNDNAMGPSGQCQANVGGNALPVPVSDPTFSGADIDRTYTWTLETPPSSPVSLDSSVPMNATFHVGSSSCPHVGDDLTLQYTLSVDGEAIATSETFTHTWDSGAPYPAASASAQLTGSTIPAGSTVVLTLVMGGQSGGLVFVGVAPEQGSSQFTLPVTSVPAPPQPDVIEVDAALFQQEFSDLANQTSSKSYNWTAAVAQSLVQIDASGLTNGTVEVSVSDEFGDLGAFRASANETITEGIQGTNGTWFITITHTDATGEYRVILEEDGIVTTQDGNTTDDGHGDGEHGDDHDHGEDEDKGISAIGLLVPALGLLAVALVARRRD